jgi:hypothetical protein
VLTFPPGISHTIHMASSVEESGSQKIAEFFFWLKKIKTDCLTVIEAKSPKSRHG